MGKLTDTALRGTLAPGRYADGDGLYLLVGPTGAKSFVYRFKLGGKERNMGLGAYPALTLAPGRVGQSSGVSGCRTNRCAHLATSPQTFSPRQP